MINSSGQLDKFYANNRFGEIIIKLCKEKVKLSSNTKLDEFLQEDIAPNVFLLWKIKEVMARTTQSTSYGNYHSLVGFTFNLSLLVKILVKDKIFKFEVGRDVKDTEFVNFIICGSSKIKLGGLLKEYQRQTQGNWKICLVQDRDLFGKYEVEDLEDELNREVDFNDSI